MKVYRAHEGDWPTVKSGTKHLPHGEKWSNVNERLAKGGRGLAAGSSLRQLRSSGGRS